MALFSKNKVDYEELYKNELDKNNDLQNHCLELKKIIREVSFENSELRSEVNRLTFCCNELENKLKNNYIEVDKRKFKRSYS